MRESTPRRCSSVAMNAACEEAVVNKGADRRSRGVKLLLLRETKKGNYVVG